MPKIKTASRSLDRSLSRGSCRRPYLAETLAAFARAIRLHRRLIKLAPRIYDAAFVHREEQQRLESLARRKKWEPAFLKIYGATGCDRSEPRDWPALPQNPRIRQAIEPAEAQRAIWMEIGQSALADFQKFQPHAVLRLTQIARLLDIGITFGRLATGIESLPPGPEPLPSGYLDSEAALEKIYGDPHPPEVAGNENR